MLHHRLMNFAGNVQFLMRYGLNHWMLQAQETSVFNRHSMEYLSEDCLNLNIMRPTGSTDSSLPILFFTHGGSFTNGSGIDDVYISNPQLLQNAIVVTYNYRLNAFGFLAHPDLTTEDAQTMAMAPLETKVSLIRLLPHNGSHDNAEAIGGSPRNIMISGESAGATSTCALLASPLAEGLFDSAILQSANCPWFPDDDLNLIL